MNWKTLILTMLLSISIGEITSIGAESIQNNNVIYLEDLTMAVGEEKQIQLMLLNSSGVGGLQVTIYFNESVINIINVNAGDFNSPFTPDSSDISNGILRITCMKLGKDLTGDLVIAHLKIKALSEGTSPLNLNADLATSTGAAVNGYLRNGSVIVLENVIIEENTTISENGTIGGNVNHTSNETNSSTGNNVVVINEIKSEKIRDFVDNSKVIIGSEIDGDLSAKYLKTVLDLIEEPIDIEEDCILVGGPVANPIVKKYLEDFSVEISNEYPGKNKGVIEKININGHTVILLAGSDKWGTKAAVEYFKTLEDIPEEPIFVEWRYGEAIMI